MWLKNSLKQHVIDWGLGIEDLLKYDVVPTPMQFDDYLLMTKPEKSLLICKLKDKLKLDDYSYSHKQESAFIIDGMAAILKTTPQWT